ncbi:hypothetical protein Lal_00035222, partial [Lupinus albus]
MYSPPQASDALQPRPELKYITHTRKDRGSNNQLRYEKFLKELCTHKRKLEGNERISMEWNVSAIIGKLIPHIPEKCKDPSTFTVPCIIGSIKFEKDMLDLQASINITDKHLSNFLHDSNAPSFTDSYTCHACIDYEICTSCIDEFWIFMFPHIALQCTLVMHVMSSTKPIPVTFFPSVLQALDWTPPFDISCDVVVSTLRVVLD